VDASLISVVSVDVDSTIEKEFNKWYDEVHVPEVLACPGWVSGARYMSTQGDPKYLAIYEMETEDAMWTPQLQSIKGFGEFWKDVESYHSRVYRRILDSNGRKST
jgi:hypothetical protein